MPFQNGNKYGKGRPVGSSCVGIARDWAKKKGWSQLIAWAEGKGYKVGLKGGRIVELGPDLDLQFEATKLLLAYGVGQPTKVVEVTDMNPGKQIVCKYPHGHKKHKVETTD